MRRKAAVALQRPRVATKHCGTSIDIQRILFVQPFVSSFHGWHSLRLLLVARYFKRVFSSHAAALNNDFSLDDFKQYFHASVPRCALDIWHRATTARASLDYAVCDRDSIDVIRGDVLGGASDRVEAELRD